MTETVEITWSYRSLSLLRAFDYIIEKLPDDYINVYKFTKYRFGYIINKKKFIKQINRDHIVHFLINQGHDIKFGKDREKKINL